MRSDQIWDILNEELPGFVTDQIVGVKAESKIATRTWPQAQSLQVRCWFGGGGAASRVQFEHMAFENMDSPLIFPSQSPRSGGMLSLCSKRTMKLMKVSGLYQVTQSLQNRNGILILKCLCTNPQLLATLESAFGWFQKSPA